MSGVRRRNERFEIRLYELMTAKEFLKQYERATRKIKRLEIEYEEERLMIDAVRSLSDNDGLPHGNGVNKPVEDRAIRLADKLARLVDARLEAIEIRQQIFDVIDQIEGEEGDVLYYRYVVLDTWSDVCKKVFRSWYKVRGLHESGLNKVDEIINLKQH